MPDVWVELSLIVKGGILKIKFLEILQLCAISSCTEKSPLSYYVTRVLFQSLDHVRGPCAVIYNEPLRVIQGTY